MESYKILIKPSAAKELEALPKKDRARIAKRIAALAANPRPMGSEKLSAMEEYRIRHGRYRAVYSISDFAKTVMIVKIAHRRDVYR